MHLVVVESPAKARTIERYLGKDYKVLASFGHVRDLPKSKLGVDIKENFKPDYSIPARSRKVIKELKERIVKSDDLYLATDLDREGEAIAWHIVEALKPKVPVKRITFSEITKEAIQQAVKSPREINMDLVDAQQARRVLDRLVGYKLSPFLWKKVYRGLSAGRVQSVAVRLVVEREREINAFQPKEYWSIEAVFNKLTEKKEEYKAKLEQINGKAIEEIPDKKHSDSLVDLLKSAHYSIIDIKKEEKKRQPYAPFTTSTLQQEASRKLGFSAKQTMVTAQRLYEGVEINGESVGLITYMRTDSVNMAASAVEKAREVIKKEYGQDYLPGSPRVYKTKSKGAQEAHEAIRPTDFSLLPEKIKTALEKNEYRLYDLIYKRALASQMSEAVMDSTVVKTGTNNLKDQYIFISRGSVVKFFGFLKVYEEGKDDSDEMDEFTLPALEKGEAVNLKDLGGLQHFTQAPPRYTEATLVKELEKKGIGRPSTYAPTMSTIVERGYIVKEQGRFKPQEVGCIVTDLLVEHFENVISYDFTAQLEDELDEVAIGKIKWQTPIKKFFEPFSKNLDEKMESVDKSSLTEEKTDEKSPALVAEYTYKQENRYKHKTCQIFPV